MSKKYTMKENKVNDGTFPITGYITPKSPLNNVCCSIVQPKHHGTSLNDHLLQGPDLINNLTGILPSVQTTSCCSNVRYREDVSPVHVPRCDRDYLSFLWWKNGNTETQPQVYRMRVHLFRCDIISRVCKLRSKVFG